jgi:hypothetical protein
MNHLNTSNDIFLIAFNGISQQFIFANEPEQLGNLIKKHNKYGIVFIKRFNQSKSKFDNLSKQDVTTFFSWDTHSILELQKSNFIK